MTEHPLFHGAPFPPEVISAMATVFDEVSRERGLAPPPQRPDLRACCTGNPGLCSEWETRSKGDPPAHTTRWDSGDPHHALFGRAQAKNPNARR